MSIPECPRPPRGAPNRLVTGKRGSIGHPSGVYTSARSREPVAPSLLRGAPTESTVAGLHAVRRADGSALLSWRRHGAADAYRVRILSPELLELAVFEAAGDTALQVAGALLTPLAQERGGPLLWDVAPVIDGDALSPSAPQIVPPRP